MTSIVYTNTYSEPPFDKKEIARYARCGKLSEDVLTVIDECIKEARGSLAYRVCYCEYGVDIVGKTVDFGFATVTSEDLAKALWGCNTAVIFIATVGIGMDRLITKYSKISPIKALILQAIGAERAEALCDELTLELKNIYSNEGKELLPRFSPGYGDLPLEFQADIFKALAPEKRIGVSLNGSLLMSPTKSVSAIIGIKEQAKE